MPRADYSLRSYIEGAHEALPPAEVTQVLLDIATALADIEGRVVHRDLKPENVLFLKGGWSLADFGISRYAEATTAPDTHKFSLSPPYAAPERWRNERATIATDVYSLGIIAFELLTGKRPFPGPTGEDFREQHLHAEAPDLLAGPLSLRSVISECLYKAPGARPAPANLAARLERMGSEKLTGGLAKLSQANLTEVSRRSEAARIASAKKSEEDRRSNLFQSAKQSLLTIEQALMGAIEAAAPTVSRQKGKRTGAALSLGDAQIEFFPIGKTGPRPWQWQAPAFDVVAHSGLIVRVPRDRYEFEGRSHSLWFCDARETGRYQWFELAFMASPLVGRTTVIRPFSADPGVEAAKALWTGISEFQLAWPIEPCETGDLEPFVDRWANWFADAADGSLSAPSTMPERPTPRNWRQK